MFDSANSEEHCQMVFQKRFLYEEACYNNERLEITAMPNNRGLVKLWCIHAVEFCVVFKNLVTEEAITWKNVHNILVK